MCRRNNCKNGNVKKTSRFICLRCLKENCVGQDMQRPRTREKDHIKNLSCLCVHMKYQTKNLEVRWCDDFKERMVRAIEMRPDFYDSNGNYIGEYDESCMEKIVV